MWSSVRWCVIAVVRVHAPAGTWRDSDGAGPTRVDDGSSGIWHGLPSVWVFVRPGIRPQIQIGSTRVILLSCRAYLNWVTLKTVETHNCTSQRFPLLRTPDFQNRGLPGGRRSGWTGVGQTSRMDHTAHHDLRLALCCGSTGSTVGVPCLSQEVYLLWPRRVRLV